MSFYCTEKVTRKKGPYLAFIVLLLVSLVSLSQGLRHHLISAEYARIIDMVLIALFFLGTAILMRRAKTKFKYSLVPGEIIVHKVHDSKYEVAKRIALDEVQSFEPAPKTEAIRGMDADGRSECPIPYKIVYGQGKDKHSLVIWPSKALARRIRRAIA